jgi:uncharacterized Zn finger protein (UPF0148 family)
MQNIFYCPVCNTYEENFKFENPKQERELTTWLNIRDGYGRPIRHIICPTCGNVLAGVMDVIKFTEDDIWYAKITIDKYNKESKDGGYIADGKLEWLINDIKSKKGIK